MKQVFISHLNTVELQLSRIAKFEELRSMQLDQSSSAAAQKEVRTYFFNFQLKQTLVDQRPCKRPLILEKYST